MEIIKYKLKIKKEAAGLAILLLPFTFLILNSSAQQTPQYTQFMLNNYGLNPAACGTSSNRYEALVGMRRQWIGFSKPPTTSFFNINTYVGRKGGGIKHGWHGIGAYWQGDKLGNTIKMDDFYVSYSYLMRLMRKGFISVGVAGGARRYGFRITDPNDPALMSKNVWLYPDFIPGIKFWNNTWTFDLSVKQLYKYKAKQGGSMIGNSGAKLPPHFYFTASQKWWPRSHLLVVQSVHLKYDFATLPSVDYNALAYLNKYFAVGLSYRNLDAVAGVLQFRWEKLVVGIAYDYSIAPYRVGFANSQEIMMGISPSPFSEGAGAGHYQTAQCPAFQY